jgi:hypothetical protein
MPDGLKMIASSVEQRLLDFLYNEDRAVASLGGAPAQETISSEAGRLMHKELWASLLARMLDAIQPDHVENAIIHADSLEKVDQGGG